VSEAALLFDSDCGFCRWSVDKILVWDRRRQLRPIPLQSREADALLSTMDPQRKLDSWHLVAPDGRVHSGGAVVAPLLRLLPGGAPLARAASSFPSLVDRSYRSVATRRYRVGVLVGASCEVNSAGRRGSLHACAPPPVAKAARATVQAPRGPGWQRLGKGLVWIGVLLLAYTLTVLLWRDPATELYTRWKQHELAGELDSIFAEQGSIFASWQASLEVHDRTVIGGAAGAAQPAAATTQEERLEAARLGVAQAANQLHRRLKLGKPLGRIAVPRIGLKAVFVQGTRWGPDLSQGPGHYAQTSLPGVGRTMAIAGHRTTFGAPFRHIDELRAGNWIKLELPYATFHYRVFGHRIVDNGNWRIVRDRGYDVLVLSACHPLYSARQRWVVFARLIWVKPTGGRPYGITRTGRLRSI
jgi:sortase A